MRRSFATTIVLLAALAGCVTPAAEQAAPTPTPTGSATSPAPMTWTMSGCNFGVALVAVPASAVQPFVPEGFRVLSVAETGAEGQVGQDLPNPQEDGNIGFEVFQCESGEGLDGAIDGVVYASVFTGVEPPAELRRDVQNHFVKWDVLIPDAPRRGALAAAGIPAHGGNASVETEVAAASATSYRGTVTIDGLGELSFTGRSIAPLPDGAFTEYTETPQGLVEWNMQYRLTAGGVGPQTVVVPDGAWFNEIIAAGTHDGFGFSGVTDFYEGSILLPAPADPAE